MNYLNGDYRKLRRFIKNRRVKLLNFYLDQSPLPAAYYDGLIRFAIRREEWGIVEILKLARDENMFSIFAETESGTVH